MTYFISAKCYFSGLAISRFIKGNEIKMINLFYSAELLVLKIIYFFFFMVSKALVVLILNNS